MRCLVPLLLLATACAGPADVAETDHPLTVPDDDNCFAGAHDNAANPASLLEELPTPHFTIRYSMVPGQEPLPTCGAPNAPPAPNCYVPVFPSAHPAPEYVEDLGTFLEAAYTKYLADYDLPAATKIDVLVMAMTANGQLDPSGALLINRAITEASPSWTRSARLRYVAWHELFHLAQMRAFTGTAGPYDGAWDSFNRYGWLTESTATDIAFQHTAQPGVFFRAKEGLMLSEPLDTTDQAYRYAAFALFRYTRARHPFDLVHRFFNKANPSLRLATLPPGGSDAVMHRELTAVLPSLEARRDYYRDFALAYQFTRDPASNPGIRRWLEPAEPVVTQLTGWERVEPGELDAPPLELPTSVTVGPFLRYPNSLFTHAVGFKNVLCDEGPPCQRDAIEDRERARVQLRIRVGGAPTSYHGAFWRVPQTGAPERLGFFADSAAEVVQSFPLTLFARTDRLVASIVYDGETNPGGGARTFTVDAAFDRACKAKRIAVDHVMSHIDYWSGPGYPFTTPEGCKKIQVKIWGGGGPLLGHQDGRVYGNAGGGGFVMATIPVAPEGELLRAGVPFSGYNGTSAGSPVYLWQPGATHGSSIVLAMAGGGGSSGAMWGSGWSIIAPPDGGAGGGQDAPAASFAYPGGTVTLAGGHGATATAPGAGGGTNTPSGNGKAFSFNEIVYGSHGPGGCLTTGNGGNGFFGGGGGDHLTPCPGYPATNAIGSGGGGGGSYAIPARLGRPVEAIFLPGHLRTPGNVSDPDRTIPAPPGVACQEVGGGPVDPGYGRLGTDTAWCDQPGRIMIKTGRAIPHDS